MKKTLVTLALLLLIMAVVHAQQSWITYKGDNRVSVKFPFTPKDIGPGSVATVEPDSSVAYIFTIVDFAKVANLDSAALAPIKATTEFASQLKVGIKEHLQGVNLSDFTISDYKGFTSYKTSGSDAKKKRFDIFMFIIGTNLYSLSTVTAYGALYNKRDTYFDSISITN
jgi:hypothetical protein